MPEGAQLPVTGIRFVYFDLDDTLLDHRRAQDLALADLHASMPELSAVPLGTVRKAYGRVNDRVWREYAEGARDKEGTRYGRFALLFEALKVSADPLLAADRYLDAYADHWVMLDGAQEAFEAVSDRHPTGLLTNGFAEAQRAKLDRFPRLTGRLSSIVISEEEGVLKPHPELFRIASDRAGVAPSEIAYVGDSLRSDIQGGQAAGWNVIWFSEGSMDGPDVPRFSRWDELPGLLGL